MIKRILALAIFIVLLSCKKESHGEVNATITDISGIDGCGLILVLDDGSRLEPVQHNFLLTPGQRVAVKYKKVNNVSICMVGETVKLISLRYI
jgi:hypothetical protein